MKNNNIDKLKKIESNDILKLTLSKKGYTIWKLTSITNDIEQYKQVITNITTIDDVMKLIPENQYLEFYFKQNFKNNAKKGRYDPY